MTRGAAGPRFWANVLVVGCAVGGIAVNPGEVHAQESVLAAAKDRAQQAPTSVEASIALGRALRKAGREADALVELRRGQAHAKGDEAIAAGWEIARTHVAKHDFQAAMASCRALAKIPTGEAASRVCAAEAHLLRRRGTEVMAALAALAQIPSPSVEVRYFAKIAEGRARQLDSQEAAADSAYREAIRIAPDRVDAHVRLGVLLQQAGKDGLASLRRAAEIEAHDPLALFELGRALVEDPGHGEEAIAILERAKAERPESVDTLRSLTEAYLAARKLPDAKRLAADIVKLAPNDVFARLVVGRVALADGKPDDALAAAKAALKLMPNEGKAQLLVADAYANKGEIDLALEAYQKASGLDPLNPAPLVNATNACIAAGRLTSARAFGTRAAIEFPDHAPAWVAEGDAFAADGNPKAARTAYESAKKAKGADVALIERKLAQLK